MPISNDVEIDYTNKIIEIKNNRYTVNELYSYIMETFDEQAQMNDLVPMLAKTPTLYDIIDGWKMSTLSWDFLYNSAVEEEYNGPNTLDIYTNVRTLGALQTGTRLYMSQGGTVNFHGYQPFILKSTHTADNTLLVVSATIPPDVPSSGSIVLDPWGIEGVNSPETIGFTAYESSTWDLNNATFTLSAAPSGTYNPSNNTFVVRAPYEGHVDILLKTRDQGVDIDGTTFSTWARKFQDTYDKFVTTGGAVVANAPVASGDDPQLDIPMATLDAYTGLTITWVSGTNWWIRSAFDGTEDVHEYALENAINASETLVVTDSTIPTTIPLEGYLQIESEVMFYNTIWYGTSNSTFGVETRGANGTDAASHAAAKDLSVYMYEYDVRVLSIESHTLKQIYNWIQWRLLLQVEIDSGGSGKYGWVTDELVSYTGTMFTIQGCWVEGFAAADANYIQYRDRNNVLHIPPVSILLQIICIAAMEGGRAAMYELTGAYDPDTYDPSDIVRTLIDAVIPGDPYTVSTNIKYVSDFPVVSRTRKAGRLPYDAGATVTSAGLTVRASNPEDTIYT